MSEEAKGEGHVPRAAMDHPEGGVMATGRVEGRDALQPDGRESVRATRRANQSAAVSVRDPEVFRAAGRRKGASRPRPCPRSMSI